MKFWVLILVLAFAPVGCATVGNTQAEPNPDPLIKVNQVVFKFNHFFDRLLLRPVAKVYVTIVPRFARSSVSRFFDNLGDINSSLNSFLQGKPKDGLSDLGRLAINTTIGVGGLLDPATKFGLAKHGEDFGQTFAVWGIPRGPYLVLPFFGPSTIEDAVGSPFNAYADPLRLLYPVGDRNSLYATRIVDQRAALLRVESAMFGNQYIFIRDAYLQRRNFLIHDGKVKDTFDDF